MSILSVAANTGGRLWYHTRTRNDPD